MSGALPLSPTPPAAAQSFPLIALSSHPLDPRTIEASVGSRASGGRVTFTGTVRAANRGREVLRLHYEAYEPMAFKMLEKIAAEAREQFTALDVAVHHRTGDLVPGDVAVVVAVAAEHRDQAFSACRYVIDELKRRAPIWKQEVYRDGKAWLSHTP